MSINNNWINCIFLIWAFPAKKGGSGHPLLWLFDSYLSKRITASALNAGTSFDSSPLFHYGHSQERGISKEILRAYAGNVYFTRPEVTRDLNSGKG
jgi:hypothetical protein